MLQQFFGGTGKININSKHESIKYTVTKLSDLINVIIPHFERYPLLTQKGADFILFQRVVEITSNKNHLSIEGLQNIINIKAAMNKGLSDELKSNFINLNIVERPLIATTNIFDPNWIAGFVSGEGNFDINIHKSKSHRIGYQVQLRFRVSQDERDIQLMEHLKKHLGSGIIKVNKKTSVVCLSITKILTINKIIIPLFEKYPILGVKYLDYFDFCKVVNLMNEGKHLTNEGLILIREIKSGMNTRIKF
jgi:LAGLIDADG endonuclease